MNKEEALTLVSTIKELESRDSFEGAGGVCCAADPAQPTRLCAPFQLIDFHVLVRHAENGMMASDAMGQDPSQGWARSCSLPPRATGRSTRSTRRCAKPCCPTNPQLEPVQLTDYKVRILDGADGTAAKTPGG